MRGVGAPWTAGRIPDQRGRTVVVTGANAGIGEQVAAGLARRGALVVMACRDAARAAAAADRIRQTVPGARLEIRTLDLADLDSVSAFADGVLAAHPVVDVLVNNAGLLSTHRRLTCQGFELMLGVNYLGHYALTARLMPALLAARGGRIVMTTSLSYRFGRLDLDDLMFERRHFGIWPAYFASKLATVLFAVELERRLRWTVPDDARPLAVCAHPGIADTEIGPKAGLGNPRTSRRDAMVAKLIMQPAEVGALPTLRAATAPDVAGGEIYGPRFMAAGPPRRERPARRARVAADARSLWDLSAALTGVEPLAG